MDSTTSAKEGARIRDHTTAENGMLFVGADGYSAAIALEAEDLRIWRAKKAAEAAAAAERGDTEQDEVDDPSFIRPTTPPQGSNHNPWESYKKLPRDHPVFAMPDEMREKCYKKGIDPVLKAANDKFRFGKTYGDKSAKGFGKRFKKAFGYVGNSTLAALS